MHPRAVAIVALVSLSLHACTTRYLPAPRAPDRAAVSVAVEAPPLREGEGQLTLDVVDGPARVELVTERVQSAAGAVGWSSRGRAALAPASAQVVTRPLCVTPCAVNLPLGQHEIYFAALDDASHRSSTGFVNVTPHPSVARHALGAQETHVAGIVGSLLLGGLGVAATLAGTAIVTIDGASASGPRGLDVAGFTTLGAGVAMLGGSIAWGLASRPESQPGATTWWTP
jgi:hypothetical protein